MEIAFADRTKPQIFRADLVGNTPDEYLDAMNKAINEIHRKVWFAWMGEDPVMMKTIQESLYKDGVVPDIVYVNIDQAYERRLISWWEWKWRKLWHRLWVGIRKLKGSFGARSAPPTRGTEKTERV